MLRVEGVVFEVDQASQLFRVGQFHLTHLSDERPDHTDRRINRCFDLWVDGCVVAEGTRRLDHANAEVRHRQRIFGPAVHRDTVVRHRAKQQRGVRHGAAHRADVIERGGDRDNSAGADDTVSRFQSDHPAAGGGDPIGASRVGPDRPEAERGRNRCGSPAGGAAGDSIEIPWIVHGAEVADRRRGAERELVHVEFPEKYGTGRLQPSDHLRIFHRYAIFEDRARRSRANAGSVDIVLCRNRDAVQWTAPMSIRYLLLGLVRFRQRPFRSDGDEGVKARVVSLDAF